MKKIFAVLGTLVAVLFFTMGLNAGLQPIDTKPIKGMLADIVITRTCPTCHGSGTVYIKKRCYSCPSGYEEVPVTCSTCNGTGKIKERKSN